MAENDEKKKLMMLAVLGVACVVVGYNQIKKSLPSQNVAGDTAPVNQMDTETLKSQIHLAESLISREKIIRQTAEMRADRLGAIRENYLPPKDSPFAWATDRINDAAAASGIKIETIRVAKQTAIIPQAPMNVKIKPLPPRFIPYQVHVKLACSYRGLRQFIYQMEESNPFVCINYLTISSIKSDPLSHGCEVIFEWPRELAP